MTVNTEKKRRKIKGEGNFDIISIMYKKLLNYSFFLILIFLFNKDVFSASWYYPLENSLQRESYKTFGQYISPDFYIGKENLFPAKYTGFHSGSDLEIFPGEENIKVPVYAIFSGEITYFGEVSGYGGLILEKLDEGNLTALYGHLNLKDINLKTGDKISAAEKIAYLGDAFSSETGGERKHLHFAIYKGSDLYFKGYEVTKEELDRKWIDPLKFLSENKASDPKTSTVKPVEQTKKQKQIDSPNIFFTFFQKIIIKLTEVTSRFQFLPKN